jgi:hypothetical protein
MFTLAFWKAATERAVKTGAQAVLTVYVVGDVALNAFEADWGNMAGIGLGGAVVSYLTSLASGIKDGNPSLTNAEVTPDGRHQA